MTGKTHFVVGEATALLLTLPATPQELLLCTGAAAVGSVICDIDSSSSKSHKELTTLLSVVTVAATLIAALEVHYGLGIVRLLQRQTSLMRVLLGLAVILGVCSFGMHQPHRSFMHSIPCWALLSVLVWDIFPALTPAFSYAMASHILLDLLNRRKVQLLYPLDWGLCFRLSSSQGRLNDQICLIGSLLAGAGLALSLWKIFPF